MAEFAEYYVQFLWTLLQNIGNFFYRIGYAFYKAFGLDIGGYFSTLAAAVPNFDVWAWILLIFTCVVNFGLVFFLVFRLVLVIRRYVIYRSKEADKDKLMEEVASLQGEVDKLSEEKRKIFALKVNGRLSDAAMNLERTSPVTAPVIIQGAVTQGGMLPGGAAANGVSEKSRFPRLALLDDKYKRNPNFIYMEDKDMLSLSEIVDRFVNFSASQLHLYYKASTIRQYFAAMAATKILILEGISGTGKTSLPYAMGKFFNNDSAMISVQPSWRERSELIGYFNEFTKKFTETDFLGALYESTLREDPNFIVLDEMNLARIEYYFADFLSIMEMPDIAEWKIDLVSESLPTDPKNIVYGKLLVPQNVWFVGTANNDDSTFTITDKVYDRAVALSLNEKAGYFDAPVTESYSCNNTYLESLFTKAWQENAVSAESLALIAELDDFLQKKFKIAFGNRIMKQLKLFVPVYVACGGTEAEGIDFMLTTKILRKFNSLNLPFLIKELGELIVFIDKKFGKGVMKISVGYIKELQKAS
jgi:membrane protein implicated in regulation of membrane protease activity